jgi:hypothetical protein
LNCPKCNNETKGIKLNGKLYCTFCGEILRDQAEILEESYQQPKSLEQNPFQSAIPNPPEAHRINDNFRNTGQGGINFADNKPEVPVQIDSDKKLEINDDLIQTEKMAEENLDSDYNGLTTLEAEKEILDYLEDNSALNETKNIDFDLQNQPIIKKNRNRAGMTIIKGEPDPVTTPELSAPKDFELEAETEGSDLPIDEVTQNESDVEEITTKEEDNILAESITDQETINEKDLNIEIPISISDKEEPMVENLTGEPLETQTIPENSLEDHVEPQEIFIDSNADMKLDKESEVKDLLNNSNEEANQELTQDEKSFFSKNQNLDFDIKDKIDLSASKEEKKPEKRKKDKVKKPPWSKKKIALITAIPVFIILILGFVGLVFYVNKVAADENNIARKIESSPEFSFNKMKNTPPGYNLSTESTSNKDEIEYTFIKFDKSEKITFKATAINDNFDIFEKIIQPGNVTYQSFNYNGVDIWNINNKRYIFKIKNVLYEISSSSETSSRDFEIMAKGIIN